MGLVKRFRMERRQGEAANDLVGQYGLAVQHENRLPTVASASGVLF